MPRATVPSVLFLLSLVAGVAGWNADAAAREAAVRVRDVTVSAGVRVDEATVRSTIGAEVEAASAGATPPKRSAVMSVVVSKRAQSNAAAVEIVVSAIVSDEHAGRVLGVLEGRAQTVTARPNADLDREMMESAAHMALASLPDVLR